MAIFFLVVGLKIRREIVEGELQSLHQSAIPLAGAVGGMLVPAGVYMLLNHGRLGEVGWAIPMATDIAFAIGVLTLLGPRVPAVLRVLLLGLAVIDDIGAILVIALFYTGGLSMLGALVSLAGLAGVFALRWSGARGALSYVAPAAVVWAGIGFTMSLFIAQLAFADPHLLDTAKLGVLVGSAIAMAPSLGYGTWLLRGVETEE